MTTKSNPHRRISEENNVWMVKKISKRAVEETADANKSVVMSPTGEILEMFFDDPVKPFELD